MTWDPTHFEHDFDKGALNATSYCFEDVIINGCYNQIKYVH